VHIYFCSKLDRHLIIVGNDLINKHGLKLDDKFFFLIICRMEYPGVGPELSFLKESGRAEFCVATDEEALDGIYMPN